MAEIYTLYVKYRTNEKGEPEPVAYAYGDEWVAMALYMDDIGYKTEAEAREAWNRRANDG